MMHLVKLLEKHWLAAAIVLFVAIIAVRTASAVQPSTSSDPGDGNGA